MISIEFFSPIFFSSNILSFSALFELNTPPSPGAVSLEETDRDAETAGESEEISKRRSSSRHRPQSHALLGSFEESALNGRLEPVSTVHGFTAELGASGSFCPKHQKLPVTVFFYTLGDNDKVSTPYLVRFLQTTNRLQCSVLNSLYFYNKYNKLLVAK